MLLCLVDNAQWLDAESADALAFAAAGSRPKTSWCCSRRGTADAADPAGIRALALTGLRIRRRQLLRQARTAWPVGGRPGDRDERRQPQALLEIPAAMTAGQRAGAEPLPAELPLGERIRWR